MTGITKFTVVNPACYDPSGLPEDPESNGRSSTAWGIGPVTAIAGGILVTSTDAISLPKFGTRIFDGQNIGNGTITAGAGGFVYMIDYDGNILSGYETGSSVYGGFSADERCVYVGSGYTFSGGLFFSKGTGVLGWCARSSGDPTKVFYDN
jgi:hypothetical protein